MTESPASGIVSETPEVLGQETDVLPGIRQPGKVPEHADAAETVVVAASPRHMSGQRWKAIFDEQFDGQYLDASVWNYRQRSIYSADSNRSRAASSPLAVQVADGALELSVLADPERERNYLNGHVSTEKSFSFRHGLAAARVKFQRLRGQHGAFWIQTAQAPRVGAGAAANGAEIDVVEYYGHGYPDGGLSHFVHFLDENGAWTKRGGLLPSATSRLPDGQTWWNRYHVFSVEWTEDEYIFRIDGRETWRSSAGVSGVHQFLVLSLLNSDWELPRLDERRLPATMYVDWVRVWQRTH